jgi:hypothetical protein
MKRKDVMRKGKRNAKDNSKNNKKETVASFQEKTSMEQRRKIL